MKTARNGSIPLRRFALRAILVATFVCGYGYSYVWDWPIKVWASMFVPAAERLLAGACLYPPGLTDCYVYPPAIAFVSIPVAALPGEWSILTWYLLNIGALFLTVSSAWSLVMGPSGPRHRREWIAYLLGLVVVGRFLVSPLENHQFDLVIAGLVTLGLAQWHAARPVRGAFLMGTGAALKCTPLLFAPYLVWRGEWRAAAVLVLTALAWNVTPDLVVPKANGESHLAAWYASVLRPLRQAPAGEWIHGGNEQLLNQSLGAMVLRFTKLGLSVGSTETLPTQNVAILHPRLHKAIVGGLILLLIITTIAVSGRWGPRWAEVQTTDRPWRGDQRRLGIEAGVVFCLMLLLSPQSSKSHYVVLILPAFAICRDVVATRQLSSRICLALLLLLGPLSVKGIWGTEVGNLLLKWGGPGFFTLTLLCGLWGLLRRLEQPSSIRQTASPARTLPHAESNESAIPFSIAKTEREARRAKRHRRRFVSRDAA